MGLLLTWCYILILKVGQELNSTGQNYINDLKSILDSIDLDSIDKLCMKILSARRSRNTIFIIGNGGSAATASHMATDLMFGSNLSDPPLQVVSLADNNSALTATGNDLDFDQIFSRQISVLGKSKDILIAISASGNSSNLIKAVKTAKSIGIDTVGIIGFDGGKLALDVDFLIHVPTYQGAYGLSEDAHLTINHIITSILKKESKRESI
jgi:D-sedoheptulose 7-phosphate isomerase